jgi:hypothetical protein
MTFSEADGSCGHTSVIARQGQQVMPERQNEASIYELGCTPSDKEKTSTTRGKHRSRHNGPAFYQQSLWLAEMSSAENGLILSGPSVNFEPAFFLWIERACPYPSHGAPRRPTHRQGTYLYIKDGRKRLRTRPPDRNGGATRSVDHRKAPDPRLRSEVGTPAFPCPVQGACGPRDGRRRTRQGAASGAAR